VTANYIPDAVDTRLLFQISSLVNSKEEPKKILDQLAKIIRPALLFDNLVIYTTEENDGSVEVLYARATGRGKKAEADVSWGEVIATQICKNSQMVLERPDILPTRENRLQNPYILGFPLSQKETTLGAMIFIRFGGPDFTPSDRELAQYLAQQVTLLVQYLQFERVSKLLEMQTKAYQLQDDFINTVSHELRSPLGFIKGYATTLLRPDTRFDQATQQDFLKIIDRETDHLQGLIENMLDSARLQSRQLRMEFQWVRPDVLITDVTARAATHFPQMQVNFHPLTPLSPITGDPKRLAQVFENLLSNAAKYAPGYPVDISIRQTSEITEVYIQDHGAGISPEYLPFIFDRFFRVPGQAPNVHGSGLGLYICKQIIQAHQGQIGAQSTPGKGTTFIISLPKNTNLPNSEPMM
jgi:signal transduction histidine kinase